MAIVKSENKAVMSWKDRLKRDADRQAVTEASVQTSTSYQVKGSTLLFNDAPVVGNELLCVILSNRFHNVYYDRAYEPGEQFPPVCYAYGEEAKEMSPAEKVVNAGNAVHESCLGCPMNEFGSSDTGRSKACANKRKLEILVIGSIVSGRPKLFTKATEIAGQEIVSLMIPPTSGKNFSTYAKQVKATFDYPVYGVITRLKIEPHMTNQYSVVFELVSEVPDALMEAIISRVDEAEGAIETDYALPEEAPPAPAKPIKGKAPAKATPAAPAKAVRRGKY